MGSRSFEGQCHGSFIYESFSVLAFRLGWRLLLLKALSSGKGNAGFPLLIDRDCLKCSLLGEDLLLPATELLFNVNEV